MTFFFTMWQWLRVAYIPLDRDNGLLQLKLERQMSKRQWAYMVRLLNAEY
jgi:hypothetical protein